MSRAPDDREGPRRVVHCADAIGWLAEQGVIAGASFVTSLPDVSELRPMALRDWRLWLSDTAARIARACPEDGVAVFYQTDVIVEGEWQDKAYLVTRGAEEAGARMLFHRIACREGAGVAHHGRPRYSHLLAFSRGLDLRRDVPRVDVLPSTGEMSWSKAIGRDACVDLVRWVKAQTGSRVIVDPFCGQGTVLAVANALGLDAIGVEIVKRRAGAARTLRVELDCEWNRDRKGAADRR